MILYYYQNYYSLYTELKLLAQTTSWMDKSSNTLVLDITSAACDSGNNCSSVWVSRTVLANKQFRFHLPQSQCLCSANGSCSFKQSEELPFFPFIALNVWIDRSILRYIKKNYHFRKSVLPTGFNHFQLTGELALGIKLAFFCWMQRWSIYGLCALHINII